MKRIAITGGAGQIAYSLIFRIAAGDLLGNTEAISLHILDIEPMMGKLEAIKMELEDCAFPLVKEIIIGHDPETVFKDVDVALLVGAKPRGPGMERKDLLKDNGQIFKVQGAALGKVAPKALVFVVGNPANTNALIAFKNAKTMKKEQFYSMMMLDENRARMQLAIKACVDISKVKHLVVWGNHSATQVPDFVNATIDGKKATDVIKDRKWLEETFVPMIQTRGAAVIKARGASSAASAAHAVITSIRALFTKTEEGNFFSAATYDEKRGIFFSRPAKSDGSGKVQFIEDLSTSDPFLSAAIAATEKELLEEKEAVKDLLN